MSNLYDYQKKAMGLLRTGSILCGGVGSGKSRTALAYYFVRECGGTLGIGSRPIYGRMTNPKPLYIITTARKRDTLDWEKECSYFLLSTKIEVGSGDAEVIVDSWNNIKKYIHVQDAFFIFDEQRVVGYGAWVKSFLKITKKNNWILLSATPGDTWSDYIPVFIANGFYKNKKEFTTRHIVYNPMTKFPKVDHYVNTKHLEKLRQQILVNMDYEKKTKSHYTTILTQYDRDLVKKVFKERWNIFKNQPLSGAGELCYILRKIVNSDPSRIQAVLDILQGNPKVIIFYNFDYELELLTKMCLENDILFSEWNGHKHEEIPKGDRWVYLVQYAAGAEAWNCIETDVIIFYSQNYSYKTMIQAAGRIDRQNTPFNDLYYFTLRSTAGIDLAIHKALKSKQNFNIRSFNAALASREKQTI